METPGGRVPRISTEVLARDRFGSWRVRWGIGRMSYMVPPGLYAVGSPTGESPVVVTANYKMSYDIVRSVLRGRDIWVLVLETYGVNVWCAAGKGTFGTGELVRRIGKARLPEVVSHRTLILPLLGAPGISGIEVARRTGFHVRFATARAADLPAYLDAGMVAAPEMRTPTFTLADRAVLVPMEVTAAARPAVTAVAVAGIAGWVSSGAGGAAVAAAGVAGAFFSGAVAAPLLLPWLPGRSFAAKGAVAGVLWWLLWARPAATSGWFLAGALLVFAAVSGFLTLNFTGATPYTSQSGVRKEMRIALPGIAAALVAAAGCAFIGVLR